MYEAYKTCIDTCLQCIAACNHCASSCLKEEHVDKMANCVQLDLECAVICTAAVELMSLGSNHANAICQICADICLECAQECEKHQHMEHCKKCAAICRICAEECGSMIAA